MHKNNIERIIESNDNTKMHKLKDLLLCLIDDLKDTDYYKYLMYEYKIHTIAYGEHLGKELAEH